MGNYIDEFVLPVPRNRIEDYQCVVAEVADIWREHGALDYQEFVGDDMHLEGTQSFNELMTSKAEEVIVFGWVVFESREARDRAKRMVPNDPRMAALIEPLLDPQNPVFDATRMAYGGFRSLVKKPGNYIGGEEGAHDGT